MVELVGGTVIEDIVGTSRHPHLHYGHAQTGAQRVYILHSEECLDDGEGDLLECEYSRALAAGIDIADWTGHTDTPVPIRIRDGHLVPTPLTEADLIAQVTHVECGSCGHRQPCKIPEDETLTIDDIDLEAPAGFDCDCGDLLPNHLIVTDQPLFDHAGVVDQLYELGSRWEYLVDHDLAASVGATR